MATAKKKTVGKVKSKIKKGDEVIVIVGKDKGRRGTVLKVRFGENNRVKLLIEGINKIKKCIRPNPQVGEQGGIKEREAYIDISNVKIFNPAENKGDKISYRYLEDGRKVRCFRSTKELIDSKESK